VNSYRRYIVKDNAAPINWNGRDNRTTGHPACPCPARRRAASRTGLAGMDLQPLPRHSPASLAAAYLGMMEQKDPKPNLRVEAYDGDGISAGSGVQPLDLFEEATNLARGAWRPSSPAFYAIRETRPNYERIPALVISPLGTRSTC